METGRRSAADRAPCRRSLRESCTGRAVRARLSRSRREALGSAVRDPYVEPRGRLTWDSGELALACTAAHELGRAEGFARGLYAAMYHGAVDRLDRSACEAIASDCGLDRDDFADAMDAPATAANLASTMDEAAARGVFGVPTFVVDGESFWGNDRLPLLRHHLMGTRG